MTLKNASSACEACRRARRKCTGVQPCDACLQRNIECILDGGTTDGRRRAARKRKVHDLESDSNLLNDLLDTVQNSSAEHAASIFALMRSKAPANEIKLSVKRKLRTSPQNLLAGPSGPRAVPGIGDAVCSNPSPSSSTHEPLSSRTSASNIARLLDSPPIRVPVRPWTSVTTDETFVCHALSCWLVWEKPFHNWIDEDLFLRDMRRGEIRSRFCSPFLVNALLAYACHFADYGELDATHCERRPSRLAAKFVEEANVHMLNEENSGSITFVQGLLMMFMAVSCTGDDDRAYHSFAVRTAGLCGDFELRYANIVDGASTTSDLELAHALDTLCWGAFNLLSMVATISHKLNPMPPPSRHIPLSGLTDHEWTPYPQRGEAVPSYASQLLHEHSKLSLIADRIAALLQGKNTSKADRERDDLANQASQILDDLETWQKKLPDCLQVSKTSAPPVLIHQSYYLSLVLSLCSYQKSNKAEQSRWKSNAQVAERQSALKVVELFQIYRSNYGVTHTGSFVIQPILQAVRLLLQQDDKTTCEAQLEDLCAFSEAARSRFPNMSVVLKLSQTVAQMPRKPLPLSVQSLVA